MFLVDLHQQIAAGGEALPLRFRPRQHNGNMIIRDPADVFFFHQVGNDPIGAVLILNVHDLPAEVGAQAAIRVQRDIPRHEGQHIFLASQAGQDVVFRPVVVVDLLGRKLNEVFAGLLIKGHRWLVRTRPARQAVRQQDPRKALHETIVSGGDVKRLVQLAPDGLEHVLVAQRKVKRHTVGAGRVGAVVQHHVPDRPVQLTGPLGVKRLHIHRKIKQIDQVIGVGGGRPAVILGFVTAAGDIRIDAGLQPQVEV